jgi:hypothetical protein
MIIYIQNTLEYFNVTDPEKLGSMLDSGQVNKTKSEILYLVITK